MGKVWLGDAEGHIMVTSTWLSPCRHRVSKATISAKTHGIRAIHHVDARLQKHPCKTHVGRIITQQNQLLFPM